MLALKVQMLVCVSFCPSHLLQLYWTSKGLLHFWRTFSLQNLLVYKSQPPGLQDLFLWECIKSQVHLEETERRSDWEDRSVEMRMILWSTRYEQKLVWMSLLSIGDSKQQNLLTNHISSFYSKFKISSFIYVQSITNFTS